LQIKTKIVSCHTADSKPVKQEINGTVILPPLVFPGQNYPTLSNICESSTETLKFISIPFLNQVLLAIEPLLLIVSSCS
jgi:hypothetical protein